jgi:hypothetical protein
MAPPPTPRPASSGVAERPYHGGANGRAVVAAKVTPGTPRREQQALRQEKAVQDPGLRDYVCWHHFSFLFFVMRPNPRIVVAAACSAASYRLCLFFFLPFLFFPTVVWPLHTRLHIPPHVGMCIFDWPAGLAANRGFFMWVKQGSGVRMKLRWNGIGRRCGWCYPVSLVFPPGLQPARFL